MAQAYSHINFTCPVTVRVEGTGDYVSIETLDTRVSVTVWLSEVTDAGKDALRRIVRQWDLDDEAEAKGENMASRTPEAAASEARRSLATDRAASHFWDGVPS
jgi:hypothetical protein